MGNAVAAGERREARRLFNATAAPNLQHADIDEALRLRLSRTPDGQPRAVSGPSNSVWAVDSRLRDSDMGSAHYDTHERDSMTQGSWELSSERSETQDRFRFSEGDDSPGYATDVFNTDSNNDSTSTVGTPRAQLSSFTRPTKRIEPFPTPRAPDLLVSRLPPPMPQVVQRTAVQTPLTAGRAPRPRTPSGAPAANVRGRHTLAQPAALTLEQNSDDTDSGVLPAIVLPPSVRQPRLGTAGGGAAPRRVTHSGRDARQPSAVAPAATRPRSARPTHVWETDEARALVLRHVQETSNPEGVPAPSILLKAPHPPRASEDSLPSIASRRVPPATWKVHSRGSVGRPSRSLRPTDHTHRQARPVTSDAVTERTATDRGAVLMPPPQSLFDLAPTAASAEHDQPLAALPAAPSAHSPSDTSTLFPPLPKTGSGVHVLTRRNSAPVSRCHHATGVSTPPRMSGSAPASLSAAGPQTVGTAAPQSAETRIEPHPPHVPRDPSRGAPSARIRR